ncbi:hypothetical protein I4F81_007070 [Pyropia yezoensis]|uniref:Uncharacterized protein n=1 Tax=Pyropia yezoensis TaxID=2788 RepID=A0ACC3C323_PYRYE|nr:hypothetical protein I4F81_007070 [Neopyropia yezoensis]
MRSRHPLQAGGGTGGTSRLAAAARSAFQLSFYVKVGLTAALLIRLAFFSTGSSAPAGAVSPAAHLAAAAAAPPPSLRIVLAAHPSSADATRRLLASVAAADYPPGTRLAVDVWLSATSPAAALPKLLYAPALIYYGLPAFCHACAAAAAGGPLRAGVGAGHLASVDVTLVASRQSVSWADMWPPPGVPPRGRPRGDAAAAAVSRRGAVRRPSGVPSWDDDAVVFLDGAAVTQLSPVWASWLSAARSKYADSAHRLHMAGYALDALDVSAGPAVAALLADDEAWTTASAPAVGGGSFNASARVAAAAAAVEGVLADTSVVAVEHPPAALAAFAPAAGVWSAVGEWHDRRMRARWGVAGGFVALAKALEERIAGGNAAAAAAEMRASLVAYCADYRARVLFPSASPGSHTLLVRAAEGEGELDAAATAAVVAAGGGVGGVGMRGSGEALYPSSAGGGTMRKDSYLRGVTAAGVRTGVLPSPARVRLGARGTAEEALLQRRRRSLAAPWRPATAAFVLPASPPVVKADGSITMGRLHVYGSDDVGARRLATSAAVSAASAAVAAAGGIGGLKLLGGGASAKAAQAAVAAAAVTDGAERAAEAARMAADEAAVTTGGDMAAYARLWRDSDGLAEVEQLAARAHAAAVAAGGAAATAGPFVSFTLVTAAFTDMALSWLCNARALDALPHALVFAAADGESYDRLSAAVAAATRSAGATSARGSSATKDAGGTGAAMGPPAAFSAKSSRLLAVAQDAPGAAGLLSGGATTTATPPNSATAEEEAADQATVSAALPSLADRVAVIRLSGVGGGGGASSAGAAAGRGDSFGAPGYWQLMLERTLLLSQLLDRGVGVLLFETDQVWMGNPLPDVLRLVSYGCSSRAVRHPPVSTAAVNAASGDDAAAASLAVRPADLVGTTNTRNEIMGNFLFLRPTLATRRLWSEVASQFAAVYTRHKLASRRSSRALDIDNDQSLLTDLATRTRSQRAWTATHPAARVCVLPRNKYVDGRWYDAYSASGKPHTFRTHYRGSAAAAPTLINNNFIVGIPAKEARARRYGHWFVSPTGACDARAVHQAVARLHPGRSPP